MEQTLAIFKPDCIERKLMGKIITMIENADFAILDIKMVQLTTTAARAFYAVHKGKPFFEKLIEFMTENPILVAVLQKENAVQDWRDLMGDTDPEHAGDGTIRNEFGETVRRNTVHGSDSVTHAKEEIAFFFSRNELLRINPQKS
ncbi:nucleoside-diphosphate kinase [candidate division KSB1 bacterium]|nr:nucleoside-diphosphate kinase [candidate division KSB1 bacterium]